MHFQSTKSAGSTVPHEGVDSSVIITLPRCIVAVTFCIKRCSTSIWYPIYTMYVFPVLWAFIHGERSRRSWLLLGTWSRLWFPGFNEYPRWYSIVFATVTVHQFLYIVHIYMHTHIYHDYCVSLNLSTCSYLRNLEQKYKMAFLRCIFALVRQRG